MNREERRKYYEENKEKILATQKESVRRRVAEMRQTIVNMLGGRCVLCTYSDPRALFIQSDKFKRGGIAYTTWYGQVIDRLSTGQYDFYLICANCFHIEQKEDSNG